jgi:hypothetical protein
MNGIATITTLAYGHWNDDGWIEISTIGGQNTGATAVIFSCVQSLIDTKT